VSRKSVYEALKTAIKFNDYPYFAFNDSEMTILFSDLNEFHPFDNFLDGIVTDGNTKLCIYAELVNGNHEGIAVTVSDDVQHFTFWERQLWMHERVAAFEQLISQIFLCGIGMLDYSYEDFKIELGKAEATAFEIAYRIEPKRFLPNYAKCSLLPFADGTKEICLSYPEFD
jgi:hypothetical protein